MFEDAPIGIRAGEAAGVSVRVVTATHVHPLQTPHPSINDYQRVRAQVDSDGLLGLEQRTL
ncbi:hypothetical protein [Pseudomonas sp. NA-150]|uniref:hypothetical protein n=1 Tax=Pseudomonas sp. NA-150 TaxID=3367525 RepID=UPI0037C5289E